MHIGNEGETPPASPGSRGCLPSTQGSHGGVGTTALWHFDFGVCGTFPSPPQLSQTAQLKGWRLAENGHFHPPKWAFSPPDRHFDPQNGHFHPQIDTLTSKMDIFTQQVGTFTLKMGICTPYGHFHPQNGHVHPQMDTLTPKMNTFTPKMVTLTPPDGHFDPTNGHFHPSDGHFHPQMGTFTPKASAQPQSLQCRCTQSRDPHPKAIRCVRSVSFLSPEASAHQQHTEQRGFSDTLHIPCRKDRSGDADCVACH